MRARWIGAAALALGVGAVPVAGWTSDGLPGHGLRLAQAISTDDVVAEQEPAADAVAPAAAEGVTPADGAGDAGEMAGENQPPEISAPEYLPVVAAEDDYVRARLAEANRALPDAALLYGAALISDPAAISPAQRGYRYAVLAGKKALALNAARRLDAAGGLTRDGTVLLLIDALEKRQWPVMLSRTDRLEAEENLAFLTPYLRSWLSLLRKDKVYIPPQPPLDKRMAGLVARYKAEQTLLFTLARKDKQGLESALAGAQAGPLLGPEARALMAAHIDRMGRRDLALGLLKQAGPANAADSEEAADADAVARLAAARKLYRKRPVTPQYGIAILLNRLAMDLKGQGDGIVAFSIARMAGFVDPANEDVRVNLAHAALLAGYPAIAITETAKVPAASPDYYDAQTVMVRALMAQEEYVTAEQAATALIAAAPQRRAQAYRLLGDVRAQYNDYSGAAEAYQNAMIPGANEDPALMLQLGAALEQAGDWETARPLLERVVELAPDSAVALNHLGYALADRGQDLPRAISLLEKANRINPDEAAYSDSLGWAYYRAGRIADALPLLERAVETEPGHYELNDHLGDVLWAAGRRFEARYAWAAALVALDDADERTPAIRQRIERKREIGPEAQ